ncbi:MAG: hypothetical protein LBC93_08805, partial [Synergistaceae bacterium]|nr:hypothetical protein [Synergistaceae bacterium]
MHSVKKETACFFDESKYNGLKIPLRVLRRQTQKPCGKELNIVYFTDDTANLKWYNIRRTAGPQDRRTAGPQ